MTEMSGPRGVQDPSDLLERIAALQQEVGQLRRALAAHAIVDQAIGVLRVVYGLGSEEAWDVLQQVSQHTNTKLRGVAAHVLRWSGRGDLPEEIAAELTAAVSAAQEDPCAAQAASGV
ncbi:ANTAR domain-containing protein [Streptomyces sp. NPDC005648]|uniref:ANTAR domain-containing protein n=1 Tax=Streptomyces sp. NPDC005648 TaxID=3157044 RepID=UPI0033AA6DF7